MEIMQKIMEQLTGPAIVDALVEQMRLQIEGFQKEHGRYLTAVNRLRAECGKSVDKMVDAIRKRTAADLFFAGCLGLKMNYEHFLNPMAPNCTWPQVDFNDYLREDVAHSLPDYRQEEAVLEEFYRALTPKQKQLYHTIMEYDNHLTTVGPKLAHYYGYLLGNTMLYRLVPGYRPDEALTFKYNRMMENYFGKAFLPVAV